MIERELDPIGTVYNTTKTRSRLEFERTLTETDDRQKFRNKVREYLMKMRDKQTFTVRVIDDFPERLAFLQAIRSLYNYPQILNDNRFRLVATDINGNTVNSHTFLLSPDRNVNRLISHLNNEIVEGETEVSDDRYRIESVVPVVSFTFAPLQNNNDEDNREYLEGEFFPFTNRSGVDLSVLQIFDSIKKENYNDSCFVYACIQSGLFSNEEIDYLRSIIRTRKLPQRLIKEVSRTFRTHFTIKYIDENRPLKRQMRIYIDTKKLTCFKNENFDRSITLLLYKKHYMLDTVIPVSTYYIKNKTQLDKDFPNIPLVRRQLISEVNNMRPRFNNGTRTLTLLRMMFKHNLFEPIRKSDYRIIRTCEYMNSLPDFTDLNYDEKLCTRAISKNIKEKEWTRIYYADFETDTSVSPHIPYLCCVIYRDENKECKHVLTGNNTGKDLLDILIDGSLTYFHNLKYDACFFINEAKGWNTKILQRSGTLLQLSLTKKSGKLTKKLTFVNSYSIIPAALSKFGDMFGLSVSKDLMAYKLYTKANREKRILDIQEFYDAYDKENCHQKSPEQLLADHEQIYRNSITSGSLINSNQIDIMKYAEFYCLKDCIVLMQGLNKFNDDLRKVYESLGVKLPDISTFVSISAIGYAFAKAYGCFDGCCELSGKPQEFILRCVSGGRCMTANNEKQLIEAKIQDFDARSLYPSAMKIMPGVPLGHPKVMNPLMNPFDYDTFFAEIRIKSLKCKNNKPYNFGQVFFRDEKTGSKIYCNETLSSFYIDKRSLQDLIDAYDIEYDIIKGYYFDQGFNNKINKFITTLYELRARYVKEKNPLEKTVKLLLNSIYGKSILKATETEIKCIDTDRIDYYIRRHYNYIQDIYQSSCVNKAYARVIKPINRHFNLPQFGASVLSWSKHLMNRVMVLAERNDIPIFYQDTDSMHLLEKDVPRLAKLFKEKYNQELIGEKLTQFHEDFDGFSGSKGKIYSRKLIALGKKSYLDVLVDEEGNEGYHIRLKGIPNQCILRYCERNNITIETLYKQLYDGKVVKFNILDGANCFRKNRLFQQINIDRFIRKVKFI